MKFLLTSLKKIRIPLLAIILVLIAASGVCPAYAADTTPAAAATPSFGDTAKSAVAAGVVAGVPGAAAFTAAGNLIGGVAANALMNGLANIAFALMSLAGYLLGLVGIIFNWTVVITVFQFANYFANSQGMLLAWGVLRDLGNILILFGFIFTGIMMILDLHSYNARQALPRLIIFAVLLNFSLFAGEAVVDVANILSAAIYQQAGQATATPSTANCVGLTADTGGGTSNQACNALNNAGSSGKANSNGTTQVGIAGVIMNDTYLSTAFNPTDITKNTNPTTRFLVYIGLALFITIVMMVLLAAVIMLFIRAIVLALLFIMSPIGFAGMAIPQLEGVAKKWWSSLLSNAFFAPIYLLIVFIGLKVMDGLRGALGTGTGTAAPNLANALMNPTVGTSSVFIIFFLVIGFMIAALMFAKNSGAAGAAFATGFAQNAVKRVALAPVRVAGGIGRNVGGAAYRGTVGKGVDKLGHLYDAKMGSARESNNAFVRRSAKFARFVGLDETIEGGVNKAKNFKPLNTRSYEESKKHSEERTKHLSHAAEMAHLQHNLADGIKSGDQEMVEQALQKMSASDIEQTKYLKQSADGIAVLAKSMSIDKFNKLMDSKEVNAQAKENLIKHRFADLRGNIANGYGAKDEIRKYSSDELTALAQYQPDEFKKLIEGNNYNDATNTGDGDSIISKDQYDGIKNNKTLTKSQRDNANNHTKGGLLMAAIKAGSNPTKVRNIAESIQGDIADLPSSVLTNPDVMATFGKSKLAAIMSKNKLSSAEISTIRTAVIDNSRHKNAAEIKKYVSSGAAENYWK